MVYIWLYFLQKYLTFDGCRGKKTKIFAAGQLVRGGGQGSGRGRDAWLAAGRGDGGGGCWCGKSQRLMMHRVWWCFFMCNQIYFAPLGSLHRCRRWERCRAGGLAGWCQVEGLAGLYPPFTPIVGTIKGFSLQKFFFGFRVPLAVSVGQTACVYC